MKIIIISQHAGMLEFLQLRGLIHNQAEVVNYPSSQSVTVADIKGQVVFGDLPYSLATHTLSVTPITLDIPSELIGHSLNAVQLEQYAGLVETYTVNTTLLQSGAPLKVNNAPLGTNKLKGSHKPSRSEQIRVLDDIRNAVGEDSDNLDMEDTTRSLTALAGWFSESIEDLTLEQKGEAVIPDFSYFFGKSTDWVYGWLLARAYALDEGEVTRLYSNWEWWDAKGNTYPAAFSQAQAEKSARELLAGQKIIQKVLENKTFLFSLQWEYLGKERVDGAKTIVINAESLKQARDNLFNYLWWHYFDKTILLNDIEDFKQHQGLAGYEKRNFEQNNFVDIELYNSGDYQVTIRHEQLISPTQLAALQMVNHLDAKAVIFPAEHEYLPLVFDAA